MQTQSTTSDAAPRARGAQARLSSAAGCPFASGAALPPAAVVAHWMASRNADDFPYHAVVAEFHRVGKHLVETELLEALVGVRAALAELRGSVASVRLLDRFLDSALDKWDGRYANPTFLGLSLLPLPALDDGSDDISAVERQYDRLLVQLLADAARFEIAAAEGATELLPQMRPDARTMAKRCRLGLQVAGPAARRLGLDDRVEVDDAIAGARRLWANLAEDLSAEERRTLQLTMLPVSLIHDEYQFIRVLQSFEATFALAAVQLHAAVRALGEGEAEVAVQRIEAAERVLHEAAPLFSLVATMQVAAFHTFREFTEGASAIQSRSYKLMESLCRQPEAARLDAAAYLSVPEVRQRVLSGQETLDGAFEAAQLFGRLSTGEAEEVEQAMRQFAATLLRWRRTHHGIAVRMLGERTGTGYTEGSAYLKSVMTIPVFTSLATDEEGAVVEARAVAGRDEIAPEPAREIAGARGRCPFAAGAGFLAMPAAAGA